MSHLLPFITVWGRRGLLWQLVSSDSIICSILWTSVQDVLWQDKKQLDDRFNSWDLIEYTKGHNRFWYISQAACLWRCTTSYETSISPKLPIKCNSPVPYIVKVICSTTTLGMWNYIGQNERKTRLTSAKDSETDLSWCNVTLVMVISQASKRTCKVQVH